MFIVWRESFALPLSILHKETNMTKQCLICSNEFNALGGMKYCSDKCKLIARRKADSENHLKHYYDNPERRKHRIEYAKKWKQDNPNKVRKIYANRNKRRRRESVRHNINNRMTVAIANALKGNKNGWSWELLVGYTAQQLQSRLQKTMPEGATWQDFLIGKLHIDHIIPRCRFKYKTAKDPEFKMCWGLNNLQLLWAKDNLSKGSN
jgi:hypothetical protein